MTASSGTDGDKPKRHPNVPSPTIVQNRVVNPQLAWTLAGIGAVVVTVLLLRAPFGGSEQNPKNGPTLPPPVTQPETTFLQGVVRTMSGTTIPDAEVEIDLLPGHTFKTTSNGHFDIQEIPAKVGDQARIYVRKSGYKNHDQYIVLPGPVTVKLDKEK